MWRFLNFFPILTLLFFFAINAHSEILILLSKCEAASCLVMDLNAAGPIASDNKRVLKGGLEELTFQVKGRSGQGRVRSLQMVFHRDSTTDHCQGLGPVAVLGMKEGHPILATNGGPVEITDGSLVVGCENCVRVVDGESGKTLSEPPSPSRNLSHLGFGPKDFSVDGQGVVWLRVDKALCLKLSREGDFRAGDPALCAPHEPKPVPASPSSAEPGFQRFESGKYQLWFADPGC